MNRLALLFELLDGFFDLTGKVFQHKVDVPDQLFEFTEPVNNFFHFCGVFAHFGFPPEKILEVYHPEAVA